MISLIKKLFTQDKSPTTTELTNRINNLETVLLDRNKIIIFLRYRLNKAFTRINTIERIISSEAQGFTIPREAEKLEY